MWRDFKDEDEEYNSVNQLIKELKPRNQNTFSLKTVAHRYVISCVYPGKEPRCSRSNPVLLFTETIVLHIHG